MIKNIRPGQLVYWRDKPAIVLELKGLTDAILRTIDDSSTEVAQVSDLTTGPVATNGRKTHHLLAKDKEWDMAVSRFECIRPLLESDTRDSSEVKSVADRLGKSTATIYRWMSKFQETGLVSSLLRVPRSDKGQARLSEEVEQVIALFIKKRFLDEERISVLKLHREIKAECNSLGLEPPNKNTIYARVLEIERTELVAKRYGPKKAKEQFQPLRGSFPGADFPYAVVQIDHTPVDVIVVDEEHRLPIGRPYLTLAIDVATKMVGGFRMTLDPPSASSAGLCIAHAVMKKDYWLAKRDILAEWPLYGKMSKIHMDNAKEFKGTMITRACQEHNIIHENRPKGQPNYGPHIERAFRTFMKEAQSLRGTTFSNVQQKMDYDSEGRACMTLAELELWFTIFVVYCYHHRPHKGISNVPPIKLYRQFVHGTADQPGVGLPAAIEDEEKFRLDFTPFEKRTVQRDGVVIDHIKYYAPTLRQWIDAVDPEDKTKARKFIFARDPRDISSVYFLDPELKTYFRIPYFNSTRPAISLWELRAVLARIAASPELQVDENMIFEGIRKMREVEESAIEKTRLARQGRATEKRKRRMNERRKGWKGVHSTETEHPTKSVEAEIDEDDAIEAFNDIEIG